MTRCYYCECSGTGFCISGWVSPGCTEVNLLSHVVILCSHQQHQVLLLHILTNSHLCGQHRPGGCEVVVAVVCICILLIKMGIFAVVLAISMSSLEKCLEGLALCCTTVGKTKEL